MSSRTKFWAMAPGWLRTFVMTRARYKLPGFTSSRDDEDLTSEENYREKYRVQGHIDNDMNCIASYDDNPITGLQRIMLDIDVPAALIPSSTAGHWHLYIDRAVPWESYEKLLTALHECGVIESGYFHKSIKRKGTFLRVPWVAKGGEQQFDLNREAFDRWLLESDPHGLTDYPDLPF